MPLIIEGAFFCEFVVLCDAFRKTGWVEGFVESIEKSTMQKPLQRKHGWKLAFGVLVVVVLCILEFLTVYIKFMDMCLKIISVIGSTLFETTAQKPRSAT